MDKKLSYQDLLHRLSSDLLNTYKNTIFSQSSDQGDSREKSVINYLNKVMPDKYGFSCGEVFDGDQSTAGQVDIIIYDKLFSPVFTDGTNKIVAPIESTYGMISVKSKMGTKELDNAIEGIRKYDGLKRPTAADNTAYIVPDYPLSGAHGITIQKTYQCNINCIFAFDTTISLETLLKKLKESNLVDILVIPGKLCAIGRERKEFSLKLNGRLLDCQVILSEDSVAVFTLLLQAYLSRNKLIAADINKVILDLVQHSQIASLPN